MDARKSDIDLVSLFRKELELCRVTPDETVAVLSEGENLRNYAEAFLSAIRNLGASAIDVNLRGQLTDTNDRLKQIGKNNLGNNREAMEQLKAADMVVDLVLLLFSKEQLEIQESGTRVLLCVEPVEILQRLMPSRQLRRRVEAAAKKLSTGRVLRFTNEMGTDITYELEEHSVLAEYGYTDTPGRWDHWPGG
ncbi:MAG: leucyl aminopeptidase, partial [Pseudomonadales bacterium]